MRPVAWLLLAAAAMASLPPVAAASGLGVETSVGALATVTGDATSFTTTITNTGETPSARILAAMNIVNVGDGAPVDPEDWSPERAQSVPPLAPGESAVLNWTLFSILEGDYLVYVVAIPHPGGPAESTVPESGPAVHVTVRSVARLNPGGVLPVTLGVPAAVAALAVALRVARWRGLDREAAEPA